MTQVWLILALKFCVIALVAVAVGSWQGVVAGWVTACAGLALLHARHIFHLSRLQHWLNTAKADELPDPWGAWGVVFAGIYGALRRQAGKEGAALRELEHFMQAVQALPHGVAVLDSADQLQWCNDTASTQLGLQGTRDHGSRITNIVRVPGLAAFLQRAQRDDVLEYRPAHQPGQVLSLKAIPFGDGRKLLVSFDITQIERADTTRRDFIANVSHELRTPLTVIHGFLEHMSDTPVQPADKARQHIALMTQQSDRMLRLVDDLLLLSRLEGGDHLPAEMQLDIAALMQALAQDAQALSAGRHTIDVQVTPHAPFKGGADELRSAFSNLVSNAVRYTPPGGRITLGWSNDEKGRGIFSVSDTGIGIAEEHIPRLTERFYRVDRGRSRETGGTGLGLAIVRHVLLRHQATLEIKSELGAGSMFRIIFPAWRSVVEAPTRPEANAA